jgi:hypothetical protein
MPYKIRYLRKKKCYSVINKTTKRVFSKCTTKENANRQSKLLRAIMFNKDFIPNGGRRTQRVRRKYTKK